MSWMTISFERPAFLALLGLLPVIWLMGRRSLSSLGPVRRWLALGTRSALLILFTLALADMQLVRISDRIVALFLVDQSASILPDQREAAFDYVNAAVARHRDPVAKDMAGVIVFGREAHIEHPPTPEGTPPRRPQTSLDPSHTNLAGALRLARSAFPPGSARRVVIISDGNQNLGDAVAQARELVTEGVSIDVAPLEHVAHSDVIVDKVTTPSAARSGTPFDVTIVLENRTPADRSARQDVPGRLLVTRRAGAQTDLVADQALVLPPGKQVLTFRQELAEPAFYTFEARFVPDDAAFERHRENNEAASFTYVQGKGRVLFIVNSESASEFDPLIASLRRNDMEVVVQTTAALFTSLAELQSFDCVVLGNVPRTSGNAADALVHFSDEQIDMLVRNVEQFGAGLVMLGGPDSFGAGGWSNSALERAMPVDFQVANNKVAAVGALMLVIDKSGSMEGLKLDMARSAAIAAAGMLGPRDQLGVVAFDSGAEDIVRLQMVGDRPSRLKGLISRLGAGGGTNMEPGMRRGYEALLKAKASIKHMIVLTDGQTEGAGYADLVARMRRQGITTTTVAVGNDAARPLLQDLASRGGGKFYAAVNPKALPLIFTRETRRVVRPLVFEDPQGLMPQHATSHEITEGIEGIPPVTGYVLTTIKDNPLVEVPLVAPKPAHPNNALLAAWTYGLGRSVAVTTDGGQRWAQSWPAWDGYEKLFVQTVRWAMRPVGDQGSFSVATQQKDGRLTVVVQALTSSGEFLSGLPLQGALVQNDASQQTELVFHQEGLGRYVAQTPLADPGTHLISIWPGKGYGLVRTGITVPYSLEYRDQIANEELLLSLSAMRPSGGAPGEIVRLPRQARDWSRFAGPNTFRRDLPRGRSLDGIWPLILLAAAGLFLVDVGNRRVIIPWEDLGRWMASWGTAPRDDASSPILERLRGTKQRVVESRPRAVAFDPQVSLAPGDRFAAGDRIADDEGHASQREHPSAGANVEAGEESYGERLLRAKRGALRPANQTPPGEDGPRSS